MATTRTWNGSTGDWNTDANWGTAANDVPQPGDTAVITGGTVKLTSNDGGNQLFENNAVMLGGALGTTLLLQDALPTGRYFNLTFTGNATLEAAGNRGFAGSITGNPNDGSKITLKADMGGNLVLLHGGSFNVQDKTVDFEGNVTLERDAMVSGDIVNNGTLSILSGRTTFATNNLTGTGTISVGSYGSLFLGGNGYGGAHQTVSFNGTGGLLGLDYNTPSNFSGTITGFAPGDSIRFVPLSGPVTSAALDTSAHTLTVDDSGGNAYVIHNFYGQAGALTSVVQSDGFSRIGYAGAAPQLNYQIGAGAAAMHADTVHSMTVPGTATPIDGTGVKIGIISDSFNVNGGAAADMTNGYLPSAGVTVLREGSSGSEDEGRAMAELIYQSAPGAKLYFASTGSGVDDFASSVQALQAAGCNVIVDDIGFGGGEPFFQLGSPAENAISSAIAGGVTYVSSNGNFGNAFYQHSFAATQQTLADGSSVKAMTFSNGTPYQSVTATGGMYDTIDLQWDAPFYGTGGVASDQPCCVSLKAFDSTGKVVATSTQVSLNGHLVAESELALPPSNATATYNIAIYENDGTPAISQVKYVISGVTPTGGTGVGGRINDPDAGIGSGAVSGHQLVPGSIAVAAEDVTNTPAFGRTPDFSDYFTSTGPGTLLFDAAGNRYAQPVTLGSPDLTGPDGIQTSVTNFTPFFGTSAAAPNVAAVAALLLQVDPSLTAAGVASILAQSAAPLSGENDSTAGAGLVQADKAIMLAEQMACYRQGTLIRTIDGERQVERAVESLAVGDIVLTASGARRPIRWLGHRTVDCRRYPRPHEAFPIRIAAHAFGAGRPARDLFVSPGHAICVDVVGEVLIPAIALVNGATIQQIEVDAVTYWHVELDSHDVILAENLAAESYLDMGNRGFFTEAAVVDLAAGPDAASSQRTHVDFCRPFHGDGPLVDVVRAQLSRRAEASGWTLECDLGLHLEVDGRRLDPVMRGATARFHLPADAAEVWLVSPTARPSETVGSGDRRDLGLFLAALRIDDGFEARDIAIDDPSLCIGFHEVEDGARRWTSGRARLPAALWAGCTDDLYLRVEIAGPPVPRWTAPAVETTFVQRPQLGIVA